MSAKTNRLRRQLQHVRQQLASERKAAAADRQAAHYKITLLEAVIETFCLGRRSPQERTWECTVRLSELELRYARKAGELDLILHISAKLAKDILGVDIYDRRNALWPDDREAPEEAPPHHRRAVRGIPPRQP